MRAEDGGEAPATARPTDRFPRQVAAGGAWLLSLRFVARILGLLQTILLARLLVPRDFGIVGIGVLVMATLEALTRTGVESALIYKDHPARSYLDTAWTVTVIRGAVLALIAVAASPLVARFFDTGGVEPFVLAIAGIFLMNSLANVGVVFFRKELAFRRQVVYELTDILPSFVVSVAAAVLWRNAWALVAGMAAGAAVRLVASYRLHPYRPRLRLDVGSLRELYGYGKWLFGTSILTFLANKGDDLFVGRLLGAVPLGLYQMAFRLGEKPREDITRVIAQVAFPAYALIRRDRGRMRLAYRLGLEATATIALPLSAALVAFAPEVTGIFLGAEWLPMVPALRLLALAGAIRAVLALGGNLSHGVGRPDLDFRMNVFRLAVMAVALYPLTGIRGLEGAATAVLLGLLAAIPVWVYISSRFAGLTGRDYLEALAPPIVGTSLAFAAVAGIKLHVGLLSAGGLAAASALGAAIYLAWAYLSWRRWAVGPFRAMRVIRHSLALEPGTPGG